MSASTVQDGERQKRSVFRCLRIAFSAGCGVLCLMLIALWVRSYWWTDTLIGPFPVGYDFNLASIQGQFGLAVSPHGMIDRMQLLSEVYEPPTKGRLFAHPASNPDFGFSFGTQSLGFIVVAPAWFMMLICGIIAIAPWLPWRFSLRTVLIATTVIAVGLGLIVWTARN
jgi:hypothetical protein